MALSDASLERGPNYLADDMRALEEGRVWTELDESVQRGSLSEEEAQASFMEWRANWLGHTALGE